MPGLLSGIQVAKQALLAHQMRLGVISHNIANAATPGYSRQEAVIETTTPFRHAQGYLGTGINIASIKRHRDPFFDARALAEKGTFGQYAARRAGLAQIEGVLAGISETGIGARLAAFWQTWNELANRPTDAAARAGVVAATRSLAGSLQATRGDLEAVGDTIRSQLGGAVREVNRISGEVAVLNRTIVAAEAGGSRANDLRDRRDLLVEELSEYAGAVGVEQADGQVTVRLGGRYLVDGGRAAAILVEDGDDKQIGGGDVGWADGIAINGLAGRLAGLVDVRDNTVVQVIDELDRLAAALIQEVNALHDDGSGNLVVFVGTDASDIAVGPSIAADPSAIRAGVGTAGDNSIALAIAELERGPVTDLGNMSMNDFLATLVGDVGARAREANDQLATQELILLQVENVRQSVSGVSLDEEAADMILTQRAFQAAAQVIDTLDAMMETVILTLSD